MTLIFYKNLEKYQSNWDKNGRTMQCKRFLLVREHTEEENHLDLKFLM